MCKQWQILVSWAPRITADGDCGHENKRHLFLGRKAMTNLDITLLTIVLIVIAVICPVVIYRCESWTIKKAEHWRIDAFELWCWKRCLRVPWTARRANQSIPKEINPEYSLAGLMLKLKLQYFGHLMQITDSLEKTPMLGKIEGGRKRGWQRMRWLDGITKFEGHEFEQVAEVGNGQGSLACCSPRGHKETWLSDWTELILLKHWILVIVDT